VDIEIMLPSSRTPLPVARCLVENDYSHHDGLLLRFWRGAFWVWHRSHWLEAEEAELRASVYAFTEHAIFIDDKGAPQPWSPNRYKVADVLDALRAVTHLGEHIDQPSWLSTTQGCDGTRIPSGHWKPAEIVATSNGLLHVGTRTLDCHTPAYFNRVAVPFPYDPHALPPLRWLVFLEELWPDDPDAIAALQEWFGYCISGRTDLHKILLLIGPTRAGKGVIARVLSALLGKGNVTGPTLASLGTNFGLQDLIGKPLATISDARLGGANTHQVVERLLSISGEDMLTIDRKYRNPWTGKLPTRFVVISNELPRFGDASGAIARRFVVLTCARSWLGNENPHLTDELLEELPGILGWALDGLDRLQQQGQFTKVATSEDAITTLIDTVSPTSAFVRDRCEVGAGLECPVDDLYAAWKLWCEDNGHDRPGTVQTFGRNIRSVVPSLKVTRPRDDDDRERRYVGVRIKPQQTGTHNGATRGPSRTAGLVHDGPQSIPLCSSDETSPDEDYMADVIGGAP
jgi:putative DNA primase/helicase